MVREQAVEIPLMNGHFPEEVSNSDWEQAKRELTGELDTKSNEAILGSAPESERWESVHGSVRSRTLTAPSDDENEEGRSDQERLVDEGVAEAELDQMPPASRSNGEGRR